MEGSTRPLVVTGRAEQGCSCSGTGTKWLGATEMWGHSEPEWHRLAPAPGQGSDRTQGHLGNDSACSAILLLK